MPSRSSVCGGCTKCPSGSGTATSFLRWLLRGRALILSRRRGARGKCRPPLRGWLRSGSLTCRCVWVSEFPLHLPEGPLTSATFSKLRLSPFCALKAVTKGYRLTRDTSRQQAASLGCITESRVGELVAERVGDVGGELADGVTETLVQVGRRTLVTLRFGSTQRTA
eukprot:656393-Pleurochrysis_carterae.AAC.3